MSKMKNNNSVIGVFSIFCRKWSSYSCNGVITTTTTTTTIIYYY